MAKVSATLRPAASKSGMYHRGRCADKWQEQVRAGNCSVQRRGSKSRSSLQRAEMIYYVTRTVAAGVMNSVSTFWHGVKVDRPPEVTPVQRACAYVGRRSGLLYVADRRTVTSR